MQTTTQSIDTLQFTSGAWSSPPSSELDSDRTLVVAFGARGLADNPKPFADLRAAFPTSAIIGCSGSGEILNDRLHDDTLSVGLSRLPNSRLAQAFAPVRDRGDSFRAGDLLARQLEGPGLKGVLVFTDGLNVNGSELARGLASVLPPGVTVTGGLAGDADKFQSTWTLLGDKLGSNMAVAIGFYGDRVRIGHGSKGGWDAFGPERRVTRSSGNVLFELDGKPALSLYKQYLGEKAAGLPGSALLFPLSLRSSAQADQMLVRTVLAVSEADNSMTFAGDVPEGSSVQLMRANFDRLVAGAAEATRQANSIVPSNPCLAIGVSCVGRRLVLGQRTADEIESTFDLLPEGSKMVGFYSYGELSPTSTGRCELHNQTMTLSIICED